MESFENARERLETRMSRARSSSSRRARWTSTNDAYTHESPHRLSYLVFAVFASKIFPKFSNFSRFFGCMTSHHSRIGPRLGFSLEPAPRSFLILVFTVYLYKIYVSLSPDPPLTFFFSPKRTRAFIFAVVGLIFLETPSENETTREPIKFRADASPRRVAQRSARE